MDAGVSESIITVQWEMGGALDESGEGATKIVAARPDNIARGGMGANKVRGVEESSREHETNIGRRPWQH